MTTDLQIHGMHRLFNLRMDGLCSASLGVIGVIPYPRYKNLNSSEFDQSIKYEVNIVMSTTKRTRGCSYASNSAAHGTVLSK